MITPRTRRPPTSCHRTIYARNTLWDELDRRAGLIGLSRSEFAERILSRYLDTTPDDADTLLVSK